MNLILAEDASRPKTSHGGRPSRNSVNAADDNDTDVYHPDDPVGELLAADVSVLTLEARAHHRPVGRSDSHPVAGNTNSRCVSSITNFVDLFL